MKTFLYSIWSALFFWLADVLNMELEDYPEDNG